MGFRFLEGGPYTAKDDEERSRVAVINATTRQRFFGAQAAAGKSVEIDGERFRVVGVVEDVSYLRLNPFADVWLPIGTIKNEGYRTAPPFGMLSRMLFSHQKFDESRPGELLGWLLGIAFLFMLLPTVNLVNVSVSRILERASEIGG